MINTSAKYLCSVITCKVEANSRALTFFSFVDTHIIEINLNHVPPSLFHTKVSENNMGHIESVGTAPLYTYVLLMCSPIYYNSLYLTGLVPQYLKLDLNSLFLFVTSCACALLLSGISHLHFLIYVFYITKAVFSTFYSFLRCLQFPQTTFPPIFIQ